MSNTTHTLYIGKRDVEMFMRFTKRFPKPQTSKKILEIMTEYLKEIERNERCKRNDDND